MLIKMRKTLAVVFKLLEASLTPNSNADCAIISTVDVVANPPAPVPYLEMRIPTALVIQQSRECTLDNVSGLMGRT